jgi:hypothetical protein
VRIVSLDAFSRLVVCFFMLCFSVPVGGWFVRPVEDKHL